MRTTPDGEGGSWESRFKSLLRLYGHRNWIVVADSAYPAQSSPGIETLFTGDDHAKLLGKVLDAMRASSHIRANVYVDAELKLVPEEDAPGIGAFRKQINRLLAGQNTREMVHDKIIAALDEAGKLFHILVLKSTLTIPYTSVFFELDCGYWNQEAEKRLRGVQAKKATGTIRSRSSRPILRQRMNG